MITFRRLTLLFLFLQSHIVLSQTITIQGNKRSDYFIDTLKQVLSYSPHKNYQLQFYQKDLPKMRVFESIATNSGIDIVAAGATIEREKILLPIRFPIVKGLFGWRIPLVNKKHRELFYPKLSMQAFQQLKVGQLFSWSDTKILESNNLPVEKGSNYQGLFEMLSAERFDYFPRSILEVQGEFEAHKALNIAIDPYILIHYPTAYFFYVNKNNQALADDISFGFEQSLKDGSFERLFMKHYGDIIHHTLGEKRRVYHLDNPFLPEKTPLDRKELWLDLSIENKTENFTL